MHFPLKAISQCENQLFLVSQFSMILKRYAQRNKTDIPQTHFKAFLDTSFPFLDSDTSI